MFDFDQFLARCALAAEASDGASQVAALAREALRAPDFAAAVQARRALGVPDDGTFVRMPTFTALPADVPPGVLSPPHDHRMWAVVAVYEGREDNVFFARVDGAAGAIREQAKASASAGEVLVLDADVIHTIANTQDATLRAVHLYGGDLIGATRSVWDLVSGEERLLDWDSLRGRSTDDAAS